MTFLLQGDGVRQVSGSVAPADAHSVPIQPLAGVHTSATDFASPGTLCGRVRKCAKYRMDAPPGE
jgi:hypothetical protein